MPSIKVLESNKIGSPESFHDAVECAGNDGHGGIKEALQSQTIMNSVPSSNGTTKEQPAANPLQQIILIIEHKIRNLEKRKNKLESYRAIEKSGKKLTGDQKTAVSKYEECLTSLELSRELSKQFQSIAAVANKEAKKEAKRSAFVRAQQENAKIREVLTIQDVLKRLSDDAVRKDFRNGANGACKLSDDDLLVLDKILEVIQPKRPEKTNELSFVSAIKQAADHLSAIADGRNKAFDDYSYVRIKDIINEVQNCGYFEKDLIVVEEEELVDQDAVKEISTDTTDITEESKADELILNANVEEAKQSGCVDSEDVTNSADACNPLVFAEAPAAAAVPTPAFPNQPMLVRPSMEFDASAPIAPGQANVASSIPIHAPVIGSSAGIVAATPVQPAAIIIPTGPMGVPPMQAIAGQQLGATTVQAVEHAYFKQHYIQQQMRPIHEVIGTANFFFLQESEIDKPDIMPQPVQFGNALPNQNNLASAAIDAQQPQQQQQMPLLNQAKNVANLRVGSAKQQPISSIQQAQTVPALNQPFINASSNNFNHVHQIQSQPMVEKPHPSQSTPVKVAPLATTSELNHIPGFASSNKTAISPQTPLQNAQHASISPSQTQQPQSPQNHVAIQNNQKVQVLHKSTSSGLAPSYNSSIQQFPSLIKGLHHDASDHMGSNLTQKLSTLMTDTTAEKLKAPHEVSEKLSISQSTQIKQHHDGWNGSSDYGAPKTKSDDQWPNNAVSSTNDEASVEQAAYMMSRSSLNQQSNSVAKNNSSANSVSNITGTSNRLQHNSNNFASTGAVQDVSAHSQHAQSAASVQQLHQSGHRSTRSASNSQFTQNNNSSSRFSNDNGLNNPAPTFFKNNERFYQQNQNNNFSVNKPDSSYHQRNSMFKGRTDSNGSARGAGYNMSLSGHNSSGIQNGNGGTAASGNIDYRSNARPVNSTRNTGPPSARPQQQRNHSGNGNYGGPRGGSNTRGQSTINA